jgi:hypothetical protein
MSYDQKKRWESNSQFDSRPQIHESRGQMRFDWSVLYTIGKIFSRAIKYFPRIFKNNLIQEIYEHPKVLGKYES